MMFELHPQLAQDSVTVGDLPLSRVLLAKDGLYPWLILVPRRPGIEEIFELDEEDQRQLAQESAALARAMKDFFRADKMNIAALGNQVPQLHVHHVARYKTDAAWPKPIWGSVPARPYKTAELERRLAEMKALVAGI